MGGQSGVINQAMQAVNQQQPQQPQYGQQQPINGNGIIAQAYNQILGQQSLGGMNRPLASMPQDGINPSMGGMRGPLGATPYNSGTPSYSIGGQTFGGAIGSSPYSAANPQMTGGQPTQSTGLNPSFLGMTPEQRQTAMGTSGVFPSPYNTTTTQDMMGNNTNPSMPMSQSMGNLGVLSKMASQVNPNTLNGQSLNPVGQMTNNVNQQLPQSLPMQQPMMASQQGMMPQRANPYQQRMDRYQQRMDRYEQSGRQIPQHLQRGYDEMKQRQQNPQMNEQRRLAKALRGD